MNGVLDVSIQSVAHTIGNYGFGVGRYCTSATFFNGYVSNMRVVRGATLYTGNFTPSAMPLATTASTLILLASTSLPSSAIELVDASGQQANINGFANTALPIVAEDPFSLSSESSMYIAGGSMGTPYFLSMSNSAFNFAWLSEGFTVEAWVFVGPVSSLFPALVGSMSSSSATNYWSFGPVSGGSSGDIRLRFQYNPSGSGAQFVNGSTALSVNSWQHVALSVSPGGSSIMMFVNGNVDASGSASGSVSAASSSGLSVGRYNGGVATDVRSGYFQGYVSNLRVTRGVAVYGSAFTVSSSSPLPVLPSTMLLLRATTNPGLALVDRSGYFTNVSSYASGALSLFDTDPYSFLSEGSFYINGNTGPFLTFPGATFAFNWVSEGMTVESWVRVSSVDSTTSVSGLMGLMYTTGGGNYWSFGPSIRPDGKMRLLLYYFPGYQIFIVGNIVISPNRWTHIAFSVAPNGLIRLFVNGV